MKFVQSLRSFIRDEDGAAAIEYGLIAALIAVAIIVGAGCSARTRTGCSPSRRLHGDPDFAACSLVA